MRLTVLFIFIFIVSSASAQRTVTFRVKKYVEPAAELAQRMASNGLVLVEPSAFTVGVLCSWLNRNGFKLQNTKMEGSRLPIVSFEYNVNAFVPLLGVHDFQEAGTVYKRMLRGLYGRHVGVGDRLYVGWLRVCTTEGDTIKLPDMKFLKIS